MEKRKKIYLISFFMLIIIFFSYWFFFLKKEKCDSTDCFRENLLKCKKAFYQKEENFVFDYNILGKEKDSCVVEVKMVFAGGEEKLKSLVNKKMKCYLPLRYFTFPEKELEYCTGQLKEEVQYILIKEQYSYVSQNLGKP